MAIQVYSDTRTLSLAATASGTLTHGLARTPHWILGTAKFATTKLNSAKAVPYFSCKAGSASVSVFNRGQSAETWTVTTQYLHSLIQ